MPVVTPQPPTFSGQTITVNRLVNNPILIQRTLRTLVQQRLVGDKILSGRVDLTGSGSAIFEVSEGIFPDQLPERVGDLMEYPLTDDTPGSLAQANTDKWGLATEISDVIVARNRIDLAQRRLIKMANRLAFNLDALILSAVGSAVTQTQAATSVWSTPATADPFADVLLAAAQVDTLNQGYEVDTVLATPTRYARALAAAKIVDRAPREGGDTLLMTGRMVSIAGLTWVKTTNLPAGVDVMVLDSRMLGSLAWEDQGGGYQGSADDVQSKRFRKEENDGWRIQARRVAVPMVQEPNSAVKITGT